MLLAMAAALFTACEPKEEKSAEPSVFKVSPTSAKSEHGFAHDLKVKVTCDISFEYSLDDGSWIEISPSERDESNVTVLTLSLSANDGESTRKDNLQIKAGSKLIQFEIGQVPVASSVSIDKVALEYIFPVQQIVQFPVNWTLSSDAQWLEFSPASGTENMITTLSFKAKDFNFTESDRAAEISFNFEGGNSISVPVIQASSLPSGDFAEGGLGIFNYDGKGASLVYDALQHQTNLVRKADGTVFRVIAPAIGKMFEISGLPKSFAPADSLHLEIYHNWMPHIDFILEKDAWVLKTDDTAAWLIDKDKCGYVVKK